MPTFLGSPCMATKIPTRGSHRQPFQMSASLFEVEDGYVNHSVSHQPSLSHTQKTTAAQQTREGGPMMPAIVPFIVASLLEGAFSSRSTSTQCRFIRMLFWWTASGRDDLRRERHAGHMKLSVAKLARPPDAGLRRGRPRHDGAFV